MATMTENRTSDAATVTDGRALTIHVDPSTLFKGWTSTLIPLSNPAQLAFSLTGAGFSSYISAAT
ncbi:hypothetical protein DFH07DRAFT_1065559 [Mycena maculata]|uniref:Uncharacterized protein n=1 Tax=Mycena maculata TaxID=230809 RepID=A0AAD7I0Z7_9AGAR|nr:hypothetical protein DFH07DRAFT_1065559 [Mycena maculata]